MLETLFYTKHQAINKPVKLETIKTAELHRETQSLDQNPRKKE